MSIQEHSHGIIPLRKTKKGMEVLLVQHKAGHWTFPKGHPEKEEDFCQTACRELFEEVGLKVVYFVDFEPIEDHYFFKKEGKTIEKWVTYFPAIVEGKIKMDKKEIIDAKWVSLREAENLITFSQLKEAFKRSRIPEKWSS